MCSEQMQVFPRKEASPPTNAHRVSRGLGGALWEVKYEHFIQLPNFYSLSSHLIDIANIFTTYRCIFH